jgi:hypothetical protein
LTTTRPTVAGLLLRGYISVLRRRGLLEAVRELVSERTRDLIDHPPTPLTWVETLVMEELMDVTGRLYGREAVKDVALETARTQAGPIVLPFMRTLLTLWGATPESIFKHLHRLIGLQAREMSVSYAPETPSSGTVELAYPYPTTDFIYASWEGVLRLTFEVCKVEGTIDRSEVFDEGRRARIKLRWEPGR